MVHIYIGNESHRVTSAGMNASVGISRKSGGGGRGGPLLKITSLLKLKAALHCAVLCLNNLKLVYFSFLHRQQTPKPEAQVPAAFPPEQK